MSDRSLVRLCLALALCCSACASATDAPIELVFDPCALQVSAANDATADEIASIDAALADWNEVAGLALERVGSPPDGAVTIRFEPTLPALFGVYDDREGTILINRSIDDERRRRIVIMHELGHAFGLAHVPSEIEVSLMNPANTSVAPTAGDVERLRSLWEQCSQDHFLPDPRT